MSAAAACEARRLRGSATFAFAVHAAAMGSFMVLHLTRQAHQTPVLHEVEFLDLKPAPVHTVNPGAAQAPPSRIRDFLKMALPKFSSAQPQDAPAVPKETLQSLPPNQARLALDKNAPTARGPALKLNSQLQRGPAANLSEIARRSEARLVAPNALEAPKTISLDAVGRRAVSPSGPAIRIEGGFGSSRSGMRDLPRMPRAAASGKGGVAATSGLDLKEGAAPPRRATGLPGGAMNFGYARGSGISLAEGPGPVGRSKTAALSAAPTPAKSADIISAGPKKAVEIAGPLAGRKILSIALPAYPDWAKAKGIEVDVLIRFFVGSDGLVQERMIIERTSGFKELDDLCLEALRKIVFIPLPAGSKEEQWGIITFRFRLT